MATVSEIGGDLQTRPLQENPQKKATNAIGVDDAMNVTTKITPPRMTTEADLECVRKSVADLPANGVALEFGPWLGAVSVILAEKLALHVVDRFSWTSDHAKKVPRALEPGESFRPLLEQSLMDAGVEAQIHESAFERFSWAGPEIDLIVVDGPKTAADLKACLSGVLSALRPSGSILLKNGLSPLYTDLAVYLERLVEADILTVPSQAVEQPCNILHLRPGQNVSRFESITAHNPDRKVGGTIAKQISLSSDHAYHFLKVLAAAGDADWDAALELLSKMTPRPGLVKAWEAISKRSITTTSNAALIENLSDAVAFHHEQPLSVQLPLSISESKEHALRGFWANSAEHPWRAAAYQPKILVRAQEFGYMRWPDRIRQHLYGKDVLDIGCGPGLHGLGFLAAGAKSYLGLDPILKPDRDRSKNLTEARKEPFGWTPNQISRLVPPWRALGQPVGETPRERRFDLCTLHNVTEHLHFLEEVFADIAARLRSGGKILYNHHNYYCWNGHHLPPKTVAKIDLSDTKQREMIDWKHVNFEPTPDHYIARGLNRVKLDDLIEITERYFDIEELKEVRSRSDQGIDRLTDEIRAVHSDLTERDLATQNLFCVAVVRT